MSHAAEAYSNIGRTNDVYATALMCVGHLFKFLLITHSVCSALVLVDVNSGRIGRSGQKSGQSGRN